MQTQWRTGPAGRVGLVYDEVRESCREMEIPYNRPLKMKIQTLEYSVLKRQDEQWEKINNDS